MRRIDVTALADGWRVTVDAVCNDMIFRSGRAAERAALRLAYRLSCAGEASEIRLYLKDGRLAARFHSPAFSAPRPSPDLPGPTAANLQAA